MSGPSIPGAFDPFAYLDAAAAALELPIPESHRSGVAANLARLEAMARDLVDFPVPALDESISGCDDGSGERSAR